MQRRVADVGGIRIRAFVEEQRGHLAVAAVGGNDERAGSIGQCIVHARPGGDEPSCRVGIA